MCAAQAIYVFARQLVSDAELGCKLVHPNLVRLRGWALLPCPAVVWELLPGSLPQALAAIAAEWLGTIGCTASSFGPKMS